MGGVKVLKLSVMEGKLYVTFQSAKSELGFHTEAVEFNGDDILRCLSDVLLQHHAWERSRP